MIEILYVLTYL